MKSQRSTRKGKAVFICARLIVAFAAVLAPAVANATIETFNAFLNAAQVVAGGGSTSTAEGSATIVFDTLARTITTDLSWVGLTGPADRSHIHDAPPGAVSSDIFFHEILFNVNSVGNSGSPIVDCFAGLGGCREDTGFVHDVFLMPLPGDINCPTYDNCDFADLLSRAENQGLYIDIHTEQYTGGEIRGELLHTSTISEPATLGLLGFGLFMLVGARKAPSISTDRRTRSQR